MHERILLRRPKQATSEEQGALPTRGDSNQFYHDNARLTIPLSALREMYQHSFADESPTIIRARALVAALKSSNSAITVPGQVPGSRRNRGSWQSQWDNFLRT